MEIRNYHHPADYDAVGDFFLNAYRPTRQLGVWLQPRWEYMNYHPMILELDRSRIALAEQDGEIVGVLNFEDSYGELFLHAHPDHPEAKATLLNYAEHSDLESRSQKDDRRYRLLYITDFDTDLQTLAAAHGYQKSEEYTQPMSMLSLAQPLPDTPLPDGFRVQSLADENDLHKINRVLWRGFNHPGEAPEDGVAGRAFMQEAPNYRKDLTMVAVAPNGQYVSFCGMWFIPQHNDAYLEPLATDPDYRRMGMARAAVTESMRRVRALGGNQVWVGSDQPFYQALGFEVQYTAYRWIKYLSE